MWAEKKPSLPFLMHSLQANAQYGTRLVDSIRIPMAKIAEYHRSILESQQRRMRQAGQDLRHHRRVKLLQTVALLLLAAGAAGVAFRILPLVR